MKLSEFITAHTEEILTEWEAFAKTLLPAAAEMSSSDLRDDARQILHAIALDLETGQTRMIEVRTVDAISTIRLLESIEMAWPALAFIHVYLDNARYHHAKLVREWLARPGCRIKLHFIPAYCPHLNPIERLWGVMHRNVTHNKCYENCAEFAATTLDFLRNKVPRNWADLCDSVTDNFRVISPKDFRLVA